MITFIVIPSMYELNPVPNSLRKPSIKKYHCPIRRNRKLLYTRYTITKGKKKKKKETTCNGGIPIYSIARSFCRRQANSCPVQQNTIYTHAFATIHIEIYVCAGQTA